MSINNPIQESHKNNFISSLKVKNISLADYCEFPLITQYRKDTKITSYLVSRGKNKFLSVF